SPGFVSMLSSSETKKLKVLQKKFAGLPVPKSINGFKKFKIPEGVGKENEKEFTEYLELKRKDYGNQMLEEVMNSQFFSILKSPYEPWHAEYLNQTCWEAGQEWGLLPKGIDPSQFLYPKDQLDSEHDHESSQDDHKEAYS